MTDLAETCRPQKPAIALEQNPETLSEMLYFVEPLDLLCRIALREMLDEEPMSCAKR